METKKIEFYNAVELHRENPDTFHIPDNEDIYKLKPGDLVKIGACAERFWVVITESFLPHSPYPVFFGTIDNILICTASHGLKFGDVVLFTHDNILAIWHD